MKRKRSIEKRRERSKKGRILRVQKHGRSQPYVTRTEHLNNEIEPEYKHKKLSHWNSVVMDHGEGRVDACLVRHFPNFLSKEKIEELDDWLKTTGEELSYSTKDSRGAHKVLSLGIHTQQGHYTIHWTRSSRKKQGIEFINKHKDTWEKISDKVAQNFPNTCAELSTLDGRFRKFGLFSYLICNITQVKQEHRDLNDHNLCIVIPTSDFEGGEVVFKYLNVEYCIQKGDMLAFNSRELWHGVANSIGDRRSIVLTTHDSLIRVAKYLLSTGKLNDSFDFPSISKTKKKKRTKRKR